MKTSTDQVLTARYLEREVRGQDPTISVAGAHRLLQLASARVSALTGIPIIMSLTNDFEPNTNPLRELLNLTIEVDK